MDDLELKVKAVTTFSPSWGDSTPSVVCAHLPSEALGSIYIITGNESLKAFKILFFGFNTRIGLVILNSDKAEVRKNILGQRRTGKCYHPLVINSFSHRNMAIKLCSRMKTQHERTQCYIILFKDWGGVRREGGVTKGEGKVLACSEEKRLSRK